MKDRILTDLEDKLIEDTKNALTHFCDMCDVVDIDNRQQLVSVMYILSGILIETGLCIHLQKDVFLDILSRQWDRRTKRTEKNVTRS